MSVDVTLLRTMLYGALMWGVTIYSFRRGGWAERAAATGMVVNTYLCVLLVSREGSPYKHVEVQVGLVDLGFLFVALLIALRSNKYWPLWFAAMQGVCLMAHFAPLMPGMLPLTYYNAAVLWSYPMLILLAFAVRANHRAQSRAK